MLIRIVKMTFRPEVLADFLAHFEGHKEQIRQFEGCQYLQVLQDKDNPAIIFSYSYWESEAHLEAYRHSEFFRGVWSFTKQLFADKPQAWTVQRVHELA